MHLLFLNKTTFGCLRTDLTSTLQQLEMTTDFVLEAFVELGCSYESPHLLQFESLESGTIFDSL